MRMMIFNADGSESGTCGNATRCVARLLFDESPDLKEVFIDTEFVNVHFLCLNHSGGCLQALGYQTEWVNVNMGVPRLHWSEIPLSW